MSEIAEPTTEPTAESTLPPPPVLSPTGQMLADAYAWLLRVGSRTTITPLHRAGLSAWLGSPLIGYQLLLRTFGRRSGLVRETPLNYYLADGSAWVLASLGVKTQWYLNLKADPRVQVVLPGRSFEGTAEEVLDTEVRARIIPALIRSTGLVGLSVGVNPWSSDPAAVLEATSWIPLVRLVPNGGAPLTGGPDDPGGNGWIRRHLIPTLALLFFFSGRWHHRRAMRERRG